MHLARVNQAPAVAKPVRVVALDVKALVGVVLEDGHGVVAPFHQQIDGLRAEQRRVEPVEEDGPAAALRVPDFPGEDRFPGRAPAAIQLKVAVAEQLDHLRPQRFRRAGQRHVSRRVGGRRFRAELDALLVDDALAADDDDVLLQVVEVLDAFDEQLQC